MSANKFAGPKLSEAQELFVATLIQPREPSSLPKVIGYKGLGEKSWDDSTDFGASIEYLGTPENSGNGTPAKLKSVRLGWKSSIRAQRLPHDLRNLATKAEQKGWQRTTSPESVTVKLGGLSITGLFGAETDPSIRVEGSVETVAAHKRIIEKLIEHTVIDDKEVPSPGVTRRYDRSDEAAKPVTLSYGAALIRCIDDISNYQPGQNLGELISGIQAPVRESKQELQNVA